MTLEGSQSYENISKTNKNKMGSCRPLPAEIRFVSFLQPIHAGSPPLVVLLQLLKASHLSVGGPPSGYTFPLGASSVSAAPGMVCDSPRILLTRDAITLWFFRCFCALRLVPHGLFICTPTLQDTMLIILTLHTLFFARQKLAAKS